MPPYQVFKKDFSSQRANLQDSVCCICGGFSIDKNVEFKNEHEKNGNYTHVSK